MAYKFPPDLEQLVNGQMVAGHSAGDDDLERLMLARSPRFQALLERSRESIKEGKGLSEESFWEAVRKRAQQRKSAATKVRRARRRN
jgi:hypothetical protein